MGVTGTVVWLQGLEWGYRDISGLTGTRVGYSDSGGVTGTVVGLQGQ